MTTTTREKETNKLINHDKEYDCDQTGLKSLMDEKLQKKVKGRRKEVKKKK